jgi:hypothetical protein
VKMHREKQELLDKLAKCNRLAREFPDGITNKNLRDLAAELEQQIHELDHPIAKGPSADRY